MAINLIDKIKPANGGTFPMVDAEDVELEDGTRLDAALAERFAAEVVDELPSDASEHADRMYIILEGGDVT